MVGVDRTDRVGQRENAPDCFVIVPGSVLVPLVDVQLVGLVEGVFPGRHVSWFFQVLVVPGPAPLLWLGTFPEVGV